MYKNIFSLSLHISVLNLAKFIFSGKKSNQNTVEHETCLFGSLQLFKLLITTHRNVSAYDFTNMCELFTYMYRFTCMWTVQKNKLMGYMYGSYVNLFLLEKNDIKTHKQI